MAYAGSGEYAGAAPTSAADAAGTPGGGTSYAPPPGSINAAEDYTSANDAYKRALIRFNSQRTGLLRQYGYAGDISPDTGMVGNIHVDGGNVHGALQELLGQQAGEDQNAEYASEDRGLHGGLAHQAESALHSAHGGQTSRLGQSLFGGLSDLDSQQLDAHSTLDQALWQLTHQATTDAVDNGDYTPASVNPVALAAAKAVVAPAKRAPTKAATVVKKVMANAYTNGSKKRG